MKWTFYKTTFLHRLIIIYLIQLVIKAFDHSFGHFAEFTTRGILFSIAFITFWAFVWYGAEWLNERIKHLGELIRLLINVAIGYVSGLITNMAYRNVDLYYYKNFETWEGNSNFNPELVISLMLIYTIGYGVYEYLNVKLEKKDEQLRSEKLLKENILAQYQSLKNQVEPHFLFNSLSVLSSIIHTNTDLASDFVVKLSKTLRFILEKNQFDLVPLKEELIMVNDYFFLLKTRFNNAISLDLSIGKEEMKDVFIPPASIQLLIENAIKHNKLSSSEPINISIGIKEGFISIINNINRKNEDLDSTGLGLKNISKRYELIAGKQIFIEKSGNQFEVKLPILNQEDYENFNH